MQIGPHTLANPLALAPMAGVTDLPFRKLCRRLGAGYVVGEMLSSDPRLKGTRKSELRRQHDGEERPVAVQIAGSVPCWMAEAAAFNVRHGAEVIDINMGCPAKKVCNRQAGSALLADEALVRAILEAVVAAVEVPVTLKIRTGTDPQNRNGVSIARIAQESGIQALAVHGRTRQDRFKGEAEYETIRAICAAVDIPVFANGDLVSPEQAANVLRMTGARGLMFGRSAQGNPWIFREVMHFLETGQKASPPDAEEVHDVMREHLTGLHDFYGEQQGVRVARKHFGWYLQDRPGGQDVRNRLVRVNTAQEQLDLLAGYFMQAAFCAA